ncbi:hypothetical protein JCM17960_06070 [Magnetospira thiophila]
MIGTHPLTDPRPPCPTLFDLLAEMHFLLRDQGAKIKQPMLRVGVGGIVLLCLLPLLLSRGLLAPVIGDLLYVPLLVFYFIFCLRLFLLGSGQGYGQGMRAIEFLVACLGVGVLGAFPLLIALVARQTLADSLPAALLMIGVGLGGLIGLVLLARFSLALALLAIDKSEDLFDALHRSWHRTKGGQTSLSAALLLMLGGPAVVTLLPLWGLQGLGWLDGFGLLSGLLRVVWHVIAITGVAALLAAACGPLRDCQDSDPS